jgi:hypothetical protein
MAAAMLIATSRAKPPISRIEIMTVPNELIGIRLRAGDVYSCCTASAVNCFTPKYARTFPLSQARVQINGNRSRFKVN